MHDGRSSWNKPIGAKVLSPGGRGNVDSGGGVSGDGCAVCGGCQSGGAGGNGRDVAGGSATGAAEAVSGARDCADDRAAAQSGDDYAGDVAVDAAAGDAGVSAGV